ncbi:nitrate/nitrite transporter [uncultured Alsobacter sp.]|uniref:MFS transporter n=1 Tax=uncultured Alsobacter sp. TaxID=1748258 RepID=UPI0025F5C0DF|nr:MFS transporter [uncultured Alsobacter sp.]
MTSQSLRALEATVLFVAFVAATYAFGLYLFPATVEAIRREIPFDYQVMGVLTGGIQAGFMTFSAVAGWLVLRFGGMRVILGSVWLSAVAFAAMAGAGGPVTFGVLLFVMGAISATIWVPMVDVLRDLVPERHRSKAMGAIAAGTSYGLLVNAWLVANLLDGQGWRALWLIAAGLTVALATFGTLRLRRLAGPAGGLPSGAAAQGTLAQRLRALPRGTTVLVLSLMFLNGLASIPYQTFISPYVEAESTMGREAATLAWRVIAVVGMFSGFLFGGLGDRITPRRALVVCFAVMACGFVVTIAGVRLNSVAVLASGAFLFAFVYYAMFGLVAAYIAFFFGAGSAVVFAVGNVLMGLGAVLGNVIGDTLKEATGSFESVYWMFAAGAVASLVISVVLPRRLAAA